MALAERTRTRKTRACGLASPSNLAARVRWSAGVDLADPNHGSEAARARKSSLGPIRSDDSFGVSSEARFEAIVSETKKTNVFAMTTSRRDLTSRVRAEYEILRTFR
jgi:hypothetical protein